MANHSSSPKKDAVGGDARSRVSSGTGRDQAMKGHVRGSAVLLLGRGIGILLNLAVQVLLVRTLSMNDYGSFAYGLSIVAICSSVARLGLDKGISRFASIHDARREYAEMTGVIVLAFSCVATTSVLMVGIYYVVSPFLGFIFPSEVSAMLLVILICLTPFEAIDVLLMKMLAVFATAKTLAIRRHIVMPALRFIAVAALLFLGDDVQFLVIAWVTVTAVAVTLSFAIVFRLFRQRNLLSYFRPSRWRMEARKVFRFSVPLLSSDIAQVVRTEFVVFMLGLTHAASTVAMYRAVLPVARLNLLMFESFKALFVPAASRMFARNDKEGMGLLYWQGCIWTISFTFPIFLVTFILSEWIVVLLFGEVYADSGNVMRWLAAGIFINAVAGANSLCLQVAGRVRTVVAIDSATVVAAIVFNVVLVPIFGPVGGAVATCLTLVVRNVGAQWILMRDGIVGPPTPEFLRVAANVVAATATVFVVDVVFGVSILVAVALVIVAFLAVAYQGARELNIEETFPELGNVPLLGAILKKVKQ